MISLNDTQVAQLIFDDGVTYIDIEDVTKDQTRQYNRAVISNVREFNRRYPDDISVAIVNFKLSLSIAALTGGIGGGIGGGIMPD